MARTSALSAGGSIIVPAINPPSYADAAYYTSQWGITALSETMTTSAGRLYYIPFFVWEAHTFEAMAIFNSGAGDNGETLRVGVYDNTGAKGPGALVTDFGQATLTGASAVRELSGTAALQRGIYWAAVHANAASAMYAYAGLTTSINAMNLSADVGLLSLTNINAHYAFRYVDTAYGALASTAVAPTSSAEFCPWVCWKA